jgi:putative transposase
VAQLQKEAAVVEQVCRVLEVSRSGYYAARKRATAAPKVCLEGVQLKAAFAASGQVYGSRRLRTALQARGVTLGLHRVRSLMSEHRLRPVWRRKFVHTTDSRHALPTLPNVLARRFDPLTPNAAWVADITYIRTRAGWLYLAVVLDLYSRKIVGWAMAPDMETTLVCKALHMAIAQRSPAAGLIVHSDRGCQYASSAYQKLLSIHGLVASMSRKGNCWDNAVVERFFLNLKMERACQKFRVRGIT